MKISKDMITLIALLTLADDMGFDDNKANEIIGKDRIDKIDNLFSKIFNDSNSEYDEYILNLSFNMIKDIIDKIDTDNK